MPAAISLNLFRLRHDLAAVKGFNAKVALLLTCVVGTMWAFWAFNGIALVSLPAAIHQHSLTVLINWVSSNWIQLILLPALMVGQNLAAVASDARAANMVPTPVVTLTASQALNRAGLLPAGSWSTTLTGRGASPASLAWVRRCGTYR